jgi:hypothetical protein
MTHISSSLNATHGEFGALTSVKGKQCAPKEGAPFPPLRVGRPQFTTWQILKLYALCACFGFAAMTLAHAKLTADLNANWEMINDR